MRIGGLAQRARVHAGMHIRRSSRHGSTRVHIAPSCHPRGLGSVGLSPMIVISESADGAADTVSSSTAVSTAAAFATGKRMRATEVVSWVAVADVPTLSVAADPREAELAFAPARRVVSAAGGTMLCTWFCDARGARSTCDEYAYREKERREGHTAGSGRFNRQQSTTVLQASRQKTCVVCQPHRH